MNSNHGGCSGNGSNCKFYPRTRRVFRNDISDNVGWNGPRYGASNGEHPGNNRNVPRDDTPGSTSTGLYSSSLSYNGSKYCADNRNQEVLNFDNYLQHSSSTGMNCYSSKTTWNNGYTSPTHAYVASLLSPLHMESNATCQNQGVEYFTRRCSPDPTFENNSSKNLSTKKTSNDFYAQIDPLPKVHTEHFSGVVSLMFFEN